jgi:hypothetical protein
MAEIVIDNRYVENTGIIACVFSIISYDKLLLNDTSLFEHILELGIGFLLSHHPREHVQSLVR